MRCFPLKLEKMHINPKYTQQTSGLSEEEYAATKIQAGFRGYKLRKQLKDNKHNDEAAKLIDSTSVNSKKVEEKSATTIQAGIRGFLVRKKQKLAADAATKIQASFRGFKTRKDLKLLKDVK